MQFWPASGPYLILMDTLSEEWLVKVAKTLRDTFDEVTDQSKLSLNLKISYFRVLALGA